MISFSRLKVPKQVIYRDLKKKKTQEQSFFHELSWCAAKINNFPQLISILQTLSRFRKLLGKDFFTNSRLCTNQVLMKTRKGRRGELKPVQLMHPLAKPVKLTSGTLENLNIPAAV